MARSIVFIRTSRPALPSWKRRSQFSASVFMITTILLGGAGLAVDRVRHTPVSPLPPSVNMLEGTDTPSQSLIVDPGWLVDRRSEPANPPLIIDLSSRTQYETGHIPGAIHGWWQDGMELHAPNYGELLSDRTGPLARQRWLQSLGITRDATIVAYDSEGGRDAARFIWMLGFMGIDTASVLNGGLAAWKSFRLPVTSMETPPPDAGIISPGQDLTWLLATDELARRLGDPSLTIVDIRSGDETMDDLNDTIRIGWIPRSISLPWTSLYEGDGVRMRPVDQLSAILTAAGLAPEDEILLYGRFGIDTGRVWLALTAVGYSHVRIYDEGWVHWASRDDLPIDPLPDDTVIYASTSRRSRRELSSGTITDDGKAIERERPINCAAIAYQDRHYVCGMRVNVSIMALATRSSQAVGVRRSTSSTNVSMSLRMTSRLPSQKSGDWMSNPNRAARCAAPASPVASSRSS